MPIELHSLRHWALSQDDDFSIAAVITSGLHILHDTAQLVLSDLSGCSRCLKLQKQKEKVRRPHGSRLLET